MSELRAVKVARRVMPVSDEYDGARLTVVTMGVRALTPFALVTIAVLATDIVFAVDSVPAVYGITGDPYLVFVTNAFALLGLRALYFVLEGALSALVHLSYGLAAILGFIGAKLVLHWAHLVWPSIPDVPTLASLFVIVGILATTVATSLGRQWARQARSVGPPGASPRARAEQGSVTPIPERRVISRVVIRRNHENLGETPRNPWFTGGRNNVSTTGP